MNEFDVLDDVIRQKRLRRTPQRRYVLEVFLKEKGHVTLDELYAKVRARYPQVGHTTVYRTMKLLQEAGLCRVMDQGDGVVRYEREFGREHHDHLICSRCGRVVEVHDPTLESLKASIARRYGFVPESHRLEMFGACSRCGTHRN